MRVQVVPAALLLSVALAAPAAAQRVSFERSFNTTSPVTLDVSTLDGRIALSSGPPGQVVVRGTATVRVAFNVPANALELAKQIAANPPIERSGDVIRLRPPADPVQRRAATVAYEVVLPPGTSVRAQSESGEIAAADLSAPAMLRTQSSRIGVMGASGDLAVTTGSGTVTVDDAAAALTITTSSSAIGVRNAGGAVKVRTQSGAVTIDLARDASVDVQTGSSAIDISGARTALDARSQSGAIHVAGHTGGPWNIRTGSGRIELTVDRAGSASFDLASRSGNVTIPTGLATTVGSKHLVNGRLGDGANRVTAESGSGAIALRVE
jgi:DUF4097 and DUF4098 domain-containing protein YvlB